MANVYFFSLLYINETAFDVHTNWELKEDTFKKACGMTEQIKDQLKLVNYKTSNFDAMFGEQEFITLFDEIKAITLRENVTLTTNEKRFLYFCRKLISDKQFKYFVDKLKTIFATALTGDQNLSLYIMGKTIPHLIVRLLRAKFQRNKDTMWEYLVKQAGYSYFS